MTRRAAGWLTRLLLALRKIFDYVKSRCPAGKRKGK